MKTWRDGTATVLIMVLLIMGIAPAAQARLVRGPSRPGLQVYVPRNEFVLEGGLALPFGDLSDEYWSTEKGLDAGTGYELGLRYRFYVDSRWAVSPSFHYVRFGSFNGVSDFPEGDDLGFWIRGSLYRYGLNAQYYIGDITRSQVVPYLTGGVALAHNIYRDELQYSGVYRVSTNNAAFNLGAGLKMGVLELSGVYHFNRFSTSNITAGPEKLDFNWDYLVFSMGFAFASY